MFGVHGISAVREGTFKTKVARSFLGPSLLEKGCVPRARLVADLRFVVETQPFSHWEVFDGAEPRKGEAGAAGFEWMTEARARSRAWLDELDRNERKQAALEAFVEEHKGRKRFLALGAYYGVLVAFWLRHCPELGASSVATSVRVVEGNTTLGSLKFVWLDERNEQLMHLECSIKFLCRFGDWLVGPHLSETLETRYRFALRKMGVAQVATESLRTAFDTTAPLMSIAQLQGTVFYPIGMAGEPAASDAEHARHLVPGHRRTWYATDFAAARAHTNLQVESPEEECWTVLPKLYWLSRLSIPDDEKEAYALPFLDAEDMQKLVVVHQMERPLRVPGAIKQRSGLVGTSPLMVCQLRWQASTRTWEEHSRGIILPPNWEPSGIVRAEKSGTRADFEPAPLAVNNPDRVCCVAEDHHDLSFVASDATPPAAPGGSAANLRQEVREGVAAMDFSAPCEDVAASFVDVLFGPCSAEGPRVLGHGAKRRTAHVMKALTQRVADAVAPGEISRLALGACARLVQPGDAEALQLAEKEQRFAVRILFRCCEAAAARRKESFWCEAIKSDLYRQVLLDCVNDGDTRMLHVLLAHSAKATFGNSQGAGAQHAGPEGAQAPAAVKQLVEQLALRPDDESHDMDIVVAVELMRVFGVRFDKLRLQEVMEHLVAARRFPQAEDLLALHNEAEDILCAFVRAAAVRGKSFRWAQSARERFHLQPQFPSLQVAPQGEHHARPSLEDQYRWPTIEADREGDEEAADASALPEIHTVYVKCEATLQGARALLEDRIAACRTEHNRALVVGIDAEWGHRSPDDAVEANDDDDDDDDDAIVPYLTLWQVSLDKRTVLLVDLQHLFQDAQLRAPALEFMEALVDSENTLMVGYGLHEDLRRLRGMLGGASEAQPAMRVVDAQAVLAAFTPSSAAHDTLGDPFGVSLATWAEQLLNVEVDKTYQCSDWAARPLTPAQLKYAALDAIVPRRLVEATGLAEAELAPWSFEDRLEPL